MKVLIVDDAEHKAAEIALCVRSVVADSEIMHASNAKDAFATIARGGINLVLLDIRLPIEVGRDPHEDSSVWLVREVQRKLHGLIPLIVGTTQYPDSLARVEDMFREYLWTIVFVTSKDDRWQRQIAYSLRYARSAISSNLLPRASDEGCDVAIVTALRIPEFEEVIDALGGGDSYNVRETGERWLKSKLVCSDRRELSVVAACADQMGMSAMAALVTRLVLVTRPKRLVLTGIMGGNASQVAMSDIVVVDETWDYRAGKITEDGFKADVSSKRCSAKLSRLARAVLSEDRLIAMFKGWKGDKPNALPTVRAGSVACSPAVVADVKVFADIEAQKRKTLGVEMEAYGCYLAAEQLCDIGPKVLCIKSVCDLGDKDKPDLYQRYCAYLSAHAAMHLIRDIDFLEN